MLPLILLVAAIALLVAFFGLGALSRYRLDHCEGPDPYVGDCVDAFSVMVISGAVVVVAAILIGIMVWRMRRRAAQLRQYESLRTERREARLRGRAPT
ncbi:MAG: hypothetical protein ACWA6X_02595 [Bauldia sp.]